MIIIKKKFLFLILTILLSFFTNVTYADDYPNTSIAIIDINEILNNSKVANNANEQIEEISIKIQEELAANEKKLLDQQKELAESKNMMAPEAYEEKRIAFEKNVQNFQIESQNKLVALDNKVAVIRAQILDEVRPILEEIADEKNITIILEKGTVILNAENMDITKIVMKQLNKNLPKINVELEE